MEQTALLPLHTLLDESIDSVKHREVTALADLLAAHGGRVAIFGCGGLGRRALVKLRELGTQPLCFCDNNQSLWGSTIEGIPILSPSQAANQFGAEALFLIAVWNPHHWYGETAQQLRDAGVRDICTYAPLFWRFPSDFLQVYLLNDLPHKVRAERDQVLEVEKLWTDEESLRIYRANVRWRLLGELDAMPTRPSENTYFPPDVFRRQAGEVVIDCGAFDGDTIRQVLDRYGSDFAAIYSLEGDAVSFEKMTAFVTTLPTESQAKIHLIAGAVGSARGVVRFTADGGTGSHISGVEAPGVDVQCYPIDDLGIEERVTLIKMDIEGAETDSLEGASRLIARDRPLLAVCVYHTQYDLWRIPLRLHAMLPKHRLFLRAYEGDGFQTVVYAVPEDRLASTAKFPADDSSARV